MLRFCKYLFALLSGLNLTAFSQNLIVNPGFEKRNSFASQASVTDSFANHGVNGWYIPTLTSGTFLDTTLKYYENVRFSDPTVPHSGACYEALALWFMPGNYRMYTGGEFSKPLESGKRYRFSFYIALGYFSTYTVDQIGVFFGNKAIQNTKTEMTCVTPQLNIRIKDSFREKCKWIEIYGYYTALGNETHFIVGNFSKYQPLKNDQNIRLSANYLLDDFSMTLCSEKEKDLIAPGTIYIKDNIQFNSGDSSLAASSYPVIDQIVASLKKQPDLKVEINGHTDNAGSSEKNQKLSEARAKVVATYLISHGIAAERIKTKGWGSSTPISKDQSKNRRVEFVFYN